MTDSAGTNGIIAHRHHRGRRLLVLAMIALSLYATLRLGSAPEPLLATATAESGQVVVHRADAGANELLSPGESASLQRGDSLATSGDGAARFSVGEGLVLLAGDSELLVLELHRRPLLGGVSVALGLQRGEIEASMGALGLGGSFVLETGVITIEGTGFWCRVQPDNRVAVESYDAARVSQGAESVSLGRGQRLTAALGEALRVEGEPEPPPARTRRLKTATLSPADLDRTLFPDRTPDGLATLPVGEAPVDGDYRVQAGDTLYSIAQQYGLSWEALWEANRDWLTSPDKLYEGQSLRIPER